MREFKETFKSRFSSFDQVLRTFEEWLNSHPQYTRLDGRDQQDKGFDHVFVCSDEFWTDGESRRLDFHGDMKSKDVGAVLDIYHEYGIAAFTVIPPPRGKLAKIVPDPRQFPDLTGPLYCYVKEDLKRALKNIRPCECPKARDGTPSLYVDDAIDTKILRKMRERARKESGRIQQQFQRKSWGQRFERSKAIRDYVLLRAEDCCENKECMTPQPFKKPDGHTYLEIHHIRPLSEGGRDHFACVAAVCPNCHKEAHKGVNKDALNRRLSCYIRDKESEGS